MEPKDSGLIVSENQASTAMLLHLLRQTATQGAQPRRDGVFLENMLQK